MDLGLSRDPAESFRLFQSQVLGIYDDLVREFGLEVIDATADINQQQQQVRQLVADRLGLGKRELDARRG
jgi:dTMP kinase